jgi:hypothetical protein
MNSVPAVIAALTLAGAAPQARAPLPVLVAHEAAPHAMQQGQLGLQREEPEPYRGFQESYRPQVQHQVHIEQRVIIRISPGRGAGREQMFARIPRDDRPPRYKEKKLHGCIALDDIAGAQPLEENRLLLFMRDHRVLSAALERACDADDFYLGFYVERNADGMLCSKRDKLQSRTGATCEVEGLSRLVAVKE